MYRCMFLAPLSLVQSCLSPQPPLQLESPSDSDSQPHIEKTESPLLSTQYSKCTPDQEPNGDILVESEGGAEGFIQFRPKLVAGVYTWKVNSI